MPPPFTPANQLFYPVLPPEAADPDQFLFDDETEPLTVDLDNLDEVLGDPRLRRSVFLSDEACAEVS